MTFVTNIPPIAHVQQPNVFEKGTVSRSGISIIFTGTQGKSPIKQLVYRGQNLEVTLDAKVNVDQFGDSAFGNVGLTQMWFGQTTFVNGEKNIRQALIGLKNQGHISEEYEEMVIDRF